MQRLKKIATQLDQIDKKISGKFYRLQFGVIDKVLYILAILFKNRNFSIIPKIWVYFRNQNELQSFLIFIICQLLFTILSILARKLISRERSSLFKDQIRNKKKRLQETDRYLMPAEDIVQASFFALYLYLNYNEIYWFALVIVIIFSKLYFVSNYIGDNIFSVIFAFLLYYIVYDMGVMIVNSVYKK